MFNCQPCKGCKPLAEPFYESKLRLSSFVVVVDNDDDDDDGDDDDDDDDDDVRSRL